MTLRILKGLGRRSLGLHFRSANVADALTVAIEWLETMGFE
ncbi:MAG: hypothetical protein ABIP89_12505 [Polyangiaceae bacterium]